MCRLPTTWALGLLLASAAASGDALLAGHPQLDGAQLNEGAVHLFERGGAVWTEVGVLRHAFPAENDALGDQVALSEDDAVIGLGAWSLTGPVREHVYAFARPIDDAQAYCFGDGSGTPCPCGNDSEPGDGAGCANTSGAGARVAAFGSAGVAADDLEMAAAGLVPKQAALLFTGTATAGGGAGTPFGDGLMCVTGPLKRLGVRFADGLGTARWGPGLGALAGWTAGSTWYLQAWYRDPAGVCGSGWNTSSAVALTLAP